MKQLNLNNQVSHDDEMLISLLKTSIVREPSEQFVEKTLEKFLVLKTKQKVYKPLKSPLYMMLFVGLILVAQVFLIFSSQVFLPNSELVLENLDENLSFQLDSWYALSPILLLLVLMTVVWVELGLFKFRNPFV